MSASSQRGTVLRLRLDRVMWNGNATESVVLDVSRSVYFSLNESAALLWTLLSEGATQAELEAELVTRLGAERSVAVDDVASFLASLRERELLETD